MFLITNFGYLPICPINIKIKLFFPISSYHIYDINFGSEGLNKI